METIEKRLLAFRETTGLHKRAFAEKISLDPGLYGRYESGVNKPSFDTLEKIAATFPNLSLNWLLTGKGEMLVLTPARPTPTPGLTSGPATVAEAENVLLRQMNADLRGTVEFLKEELGKFGGSLEAALHGILPKLPSGQRMAVPA